MRILLLGVSSLFQRRILPAFKSIPEITGLDIASRRNPTPLAGLNCPLPIGKVFSDYRTALTESDAGMVYISTENSLHGELAELALQAGKHVVVDKPATLAAAQTVRLADLARARGVCLAECVSFPFHPVFRSIQEEVRRLGPARHILSNFSFPPLPPENFRNRASLGGGALHDLAAYTVSPGRLLFGGLPTRVLGVQTSRGPEVETAYTALLEYAGGRTLSGHFGFHTEYRNHMVVLGENYLIEVPRVFTPPAGTTLCIVVRRGNQDYPVECIPGDAFEGFFRAVLHDVAAGSWDAWSQRLRDDAAASEMLRRAVLGGESS